MGLFDNVVPPAGYTIDPPIPPTPYRAPDGLPPAMPPPGVDAGALAAPAPPPAAPQGLLPPPMPSPEAEAAPAPGSAHGFLSGLGDVLKRATATTADGLTFGDRLQAIGSILQGDTPGAQAYLKDRRDEASKQKLQVRQQAMLKERAQAFRDAIQPDGSINFKTLMSEGSDALEPDDIAKLYGAFGLSKRHTSFRTPLPGPGGAVSFDERKGTSTRIADPTTPKHDPMYTYDENDQPVGLNPLFFAALDRKNKIVQGDKVFAPRAARGGASPYGKLKDPKDMTPAELQAVEQAMRPKGG